MSILVFEHSDSTNAERLAVTLRDYGHRLRIIQLQQGDDVPPDLDDVDGIISCGGPQSAYDNSVSWLNAEMDLMRAANSVDMPIIGLCLGSQILARALGGTVEKNPAGIEFGWHEVKLNPTGREDAVHAGIAWTSMQFHHHRDHITQLPAGARLLASSTKCKVQTWAMGLRSYGFQYHPEVTLQTIERWAAEEPEALREANISLDELRKQNEKYFVHFQRLSQRLFEQIALFVMPVDRRYQGLVKDLHY